MDKARPIIIVKKKGGHGGHHGGAWKVAYADFVTAMMALFIVLWLMNTSKPVKQAIAGYFQDPSGTGEKSGSSQTGTGEGVTVSKDEVSKLKDILQSAIEHIPDFDKIKDQIKMTVTPEGLRIELLETETGTFFDLGKSAPNKSGKELLIAVAQELGKVPNKITIEGHTDSKPYNGKGGYSNWELSADRANSTRRIMQEAGLRADQVSQVRGFADQQLRDPEHPFDPSNRRISVIVHSIPKNESEEESSSAEEGGEHAQPAHESEHGQPSNESEHAEPSHH